MDAVRKMSKPWSMGAVLLVMLLCCTSAAAQDAFRGKIQPSNSNDDRCLAPVSGGFGLTDCSQAPVASFDAGRIFFGDTCISVPLSGNPFAQQEGKWRSGTTLKKASCSGSAEPEALKRWSLDGGEIRATHSPDPAGDPKCLSIPGGGIGGLRAIIINCSEDHTRWKLVD